MSNSIETLLSAGIGFGVIFWIALILINIFSVIFYWRIFKKAGKKGWETLIPVYNLVVLLKIINLPVWYIFFYFIPGVNVVFLILLFINLAKKFGRTTAFGVGLAFFKPFFLAFLAFDSDCVYQGTTEEPYGQMYNGQPAIQNFQGQNSNCSRCGAPVNSKDKFCTSCGNQIN